MSHLEGKVAIVTGAGSGIGLGTAKKLAEDGAAVAVADLDESSAQEVAESIKQEGGQAIAIKVDVSNEASSKKMVEATVEAFGRLDILHNNAAFTGKAGQDGDTDLLNVDTDIWDKTMAVNLRGPMLGSKYAVPEMVKSGGGSIINTSSGSAESGDYARTAYSASKAGLLSLTQSIATQYGKQGIRCNAILPGLILTPASEYQFSEEMMNVLKEGHLTPDVGRPTDIGALVSFLSSDDAQFITGQEIKCDGGVLVRSGATGIMKYLEDHQNESK